MRLHSNLLLLVLYVVTGLLCAPLSLAQQQPTPAEVERAIAELRADPNLSGERKSRILTWRDEDEAPEPGRDLQWLADLVSAIASGSRVLMWIILALIVTLIAVVIIRQVRQYERAGRSSRPGVPTHVREFDIRPESLPEDVGAAALALWRQGEHRASLSLLYRGMLSRLVHTHSVPIKGSSTEGECVALAERHVARDTSTYVSQLVRVWQQGVYGARDPQSDAVETLCAQFDQALPRVVADGNAS